MSGYRIIDGSVHVWSGDTGRYPFRPIDAVDVPAAAAPAERMLADLQRAGVGAAIAVQPRAYGYDHSYLAEAIARYPDRIAGVCLVDPDTSGAAEALTKLTALGIRGLRLIALDGGRDGLAGAYLPQLLSRSAELATAISLLVAPDRLAKVYVLAAEHAGTTFIVDHLGLCSATTPAEHIADLISLAQLPNVSLRLSAMTALSARGYPFEDLMPLVRAVYKAFGSHRLLWGTDYPHVLDSGSYVQSLDAVRSHMPFIDAADLPAILGGNAARLYRLAKEPHP